MRPIVTNFSVVCRSVRHTSEPCKNGWTNWDAVWVENLGRPRESRYPMGRGNFHKKGRPIVKYGNTLQSSVQTRLNWSRWHLGCGLSRDEADVQSYSPGGANLPDDTLREPGLWTRVGLRKHKFYLFGRWFYEGTLAPMVNMTEPPVCGRMRLYIKLLWPLITHILIQRYHLNDAE